MEGEASLASKGSEVRSCFWRGSSAQRRSGCVEGDDRRSALRESASFPASRRWRTVPRTRTRNPDLEARWRERVEAWRRSGLTAAQFAAQNGFSASSLTGWSSKLRHRPAPRPSAPAFVQLSDEQSRVTRERSRETLAVGYVLRRAKALRRFLDDSRLVMTNNATERGLRSIAIGRTNWLCCGSDNHANAKLFSLVASCRLNGLDTDLYLSEMIHIVPHWPRDRMLELCPRDWARTRARLVAVELRREVGVITVPVDEEKQ
jgi:hypothetical protein